MERRTSIGAIKNEEEKQVTECSNESKNRNELIAFSTRVLYPSIDERPRGFIHKLLLECNIYPRQTLRGVPSPVNEFYISKTNQQVQAKNLSRRYVAQSGRYKCVFFQAFLV